MLYADFFFRMKKQDAICVAGWTMGRLDNAVLTIGETRLPMTAHLAHLRADLPTGATGFILRFDLGGEILDIDNTKLRMEHPARTAAFPAASANLEALVNAAPDELFTCLLIGVAEGLFTIEGSGAQVQVHKRAVGMAANRGFAELPGAAVAQDQAMLFANPARVMVSGWMGNDGEAQDLCSHALVLDAMGIQKLNLYPDSLLRPDLAGVQIRGLKVGATSGYVAAARLARAPGPNAVALVGTIHKGHAVGSLRQVQPTGAPELGRQFDTLRRNLTAADLAEDILGNLMPTLPPLSLSETPEGVIRVDRPEEPEGLAYVVEHDLDPWLGRDLLRLLRRAEPQARVVRLITDGMSEGLIRAAMADRVEAGDTPAEVDQMASNAALVTWAPSARHLVVSASSVLFQTDPFAELARARDEGVPVFCLVLTDTMQTGRAEISAEEGIAALVSGAPYVAQLDQALLEPAYPPQSLHLSQSGQVRWLLVALARGGLVTFVESSGLGFLPGRDPVPLNNRLIELRAMRLAAAAGETSK